MAQIDPKAYEAVAKLHSEVLAHTARRKSFADNPMETLADAGLSADDIPSKLLDTLGDMSFEELSVVARVGSALLDSGFSPVPDPGTSGIII